MRSFLAATLACGLLAGCSQLPLYEPITLHEHEDSEALRARFERIADPVELMYEVISTTNYRCDMFFEALDHLQSKTDYGVRQLASLSTGLPPVLEAAHASARSVATVAAALGFATGALKDAKELFLLSEFRPAIYKKWQAARDAQRIVIEDVVRSRRVGRAELKMHLYEYARICLPTQLKAWIHDASQIGTLVPAASAGFGGGGGAGVRAFGAAVAVEPDRRGPRPLVVQ